MTTAQSNVPENYLYFQSDKLLYQPQPRFLFADLALKAISGSLPIPANFGLDGRSIPATGASYPSADQYRLKLAGDLPTTIFAMGVDFSKKSGDTVKINRPTWITSSSYDAAGRELKPRQVIGTTPVAFGSEQTYLQLRRYGGPRDANGVAPVGIEAFDANMGLYDMNSQAGQSLVNDFHQWLDTVHVKLGDVGTAMYPEGMNADDDATSGGTSGPMFPLTIEQMLRLWQQMDDAFLPVFPDGSRVLVLTPTQVKQMKLDPDFKANSAFHPEFNVLFQGNYVASVCGFHVFKSSTLRTVNNSSSVKVHYGQAFAPGAYMIGAGRPPSIRVNTNDNYGETTMAIWLADLAFGVADARMVYSVRSSA